MKTIPKWMVCVSILVIFPGCSLWWGVDPQERPTTEVTLCDNGLDDDLDRLSDCEDPDCAWVEHCLSDRRNLPYEGVSCVYSVQSLSDQFLRGETAIQRPLGCIALANDESFGESDLVCGPRRLEINVTDRSLAAAYQLANWNVQARDFCTEIQRTVIDANTCDLESGVEEGCDAPVLICKNRSECEDFLLFPNGSRADSSSGGESGIVSNNLDLWLDETDFFAIQSSLMRLSPQMVSRNTSSQPLPCSNRDMCRDDCQLFLELIPKAIGFSYPALRLRYTALSGGEVEVGYELQGVDIDSAVDDPGEQQCARFTMSDTSQAVDLRIEGPYFKSGSKGASAPKLVVTMLDGGTKRALCEIPWKSIRTGEGRVEYELRYLRSGPFGPGRLLLDGVTVARRTVAADAREVCGVSEVGIFQGGRTLCQTPVGSIKNVFAANTVGLETRRFLLAQSELDQRLRLFEEKNKVLFQVDLDPNGENFRDGGRFVDFAQVGVTPEDVRLRAWFFDEANNFWAQDVVVRTLDDTDSADVAMVASPVAVSRIGETMDVTDLATPGDLFHWQSNSEEEYRYLAVTRDAVLLAASEDGISDWRILHQSTALKARLLEFENLSGERVIDLTVQPLPRDYHETTSDVFLVLLSTVNDTTGEPDVNLHLLSMVFDAITLTLDVFYHEAFQTQPVQFVTEEQVAPEVSCDELACQTSFGLSAMALDDARGLLTLYVSTESRDESGFLESPQPNSCMQSEHTSFPTNSGTLWRRLFLDLRRIGIASIPD